MFLIRVNCKVGMKWATIEKDEGVNILLKYVCCVIWRIHIQIHTLFALGYHCRFYFKTVISVTKPKLFQEISTSLESSSINESSSSTSSHHIKHVIIVRMYII